LKAIGRDVVPPLIDTAKDTGRAEQARAAAIFVLAGVKPSATEAAPALRAIMKDANPRVRYSAALALGEIEPASRAEARAVLLELTRHPDEAVRRAAEKGLASLGGP
jgi:HEAT repeat protein